MKKKEEKQNRIAARRGRVKGRKGRNGAWQLIAMIRRESFNRQHIKFH